MLHSRRTEKHNTNQAISARFVAIGLLGSSSGFIPFSAEAVSELASRATTIALTSALVGSFSLAMLRGIENDYAKAQEAMRTRTTEIRM
jgi:hypothetical protein